jgi:hypothetical protein
MRSKYDRFKEGDIYLFKDPACSPFKKLVKQRSFDMDQSAKSAMSSCYQLYLNATVGLCLCVYVRGVSEQPFSRCPYVLAH